MPGTHDRGVFLPCLHIALLLGALALLGRPAAARAEAVEPARAEAAVDGWLKTGTEPLGASLGYEIDRIDTVSNDQGQAVYYVVHLAPNGFVIVSVDDAVEPILCFSSSDQYDTGDGNPFWSMAAADMKARIEQAAAVASDSGEISTLSQADEQAIAQTVSDARAKWQWLTSVSSDSGMTLSLPSVSDLRVAPLLASTWGQANVGDYANGISCYNYYTPPHEAGNPDNYPVGCVATAVAQLLRHHRHPAASYDWSLMPLEPDFGITPAQRQAIGAFCFEIAEAIGTSYGPQSSGGSSASLATADAQLQSYFGCANSIHGYEPAMGPVLHAMINPNLDAGVPVLLGLDGPSGGHSIVCDGYGYNVSTLYHHLNMGWSGRYDLWYALPAVEAFSSFNAVHTCVYNIFPSDTGEIVSGRVMDVAGNGIGGVQIEAVVAGGATRYATTDVAGIYAVTGLPSNRSLTIHATKPPHAFMSRNVSTGQSVDTGPTSGNVWGVDLVSTSLAPPAALDMQLTALSGRKVDITLQATDDGYPDPPGRFEYVVTSLPEHGMLADPAAGHIAAVPHTLAEGGRIVEYTSCSRFAGADSFTFAADDGGTSPTGGRSESALVTIDVNNVAYGTYVTSTDTIAAWPLATSYHDSRTQVIYPAELVGHAGKITALALDVHTVPGRTLDNWSIRVQHTALTEYGSPAFETGGWTTVYQGDAEVDSTGWFWFEFQQDFDYNGSDNLLIDFSYDTSGTSADGLCRVSDTGATRVVMASSNSGHGDPLDWSPWTFSEVYISSAVPNIKVATTLRAAMLEGDFNADCEVNVADLIMLASAWLSRPGDANWDPSCDIAATGDGTINGLDFAVLADRWLEYQP